VTADATYTAVFAIDQFTVTVIGEHGKVTGAGTYDYGKKVTLKATADEHYHFVKWSDGNTNATREITVTKKNVQAASASQAGLMSAADFSKLAALQECSDDDIDSIFA
jgi:hypothetical protein